MNKTIKHEETGAEFELDFSQWPDGTDTDEIARLTEEVLNCHQEYTLRNIQNALENDYRNHCGDMDLLLWIHELETVGCAKTGMNCETIITNKDKTDE